MIDITFAENLEAIAQFLTDLVEQIILFQQFNVESLDFKHVPILSGSYWPYLTFLKIKYYSLA